MEEPRDGHDGFYDDFHKDESDGADPTSSGLLFDDGCHPGCWAGFLERNVLGRIPVLLLRGLVGEGGRSRVGSLDVVEEEESSGDASEGEDDLVESEGLLDKDVFGGGRSEELSRERKRSAREGIRGVGSMLLVGEETDGGERGGRRWEAEEGGTERGKESDASAGRGKKRSSSPSSDEEREEERRRHRRGGASRRRRGAGGKGGRREVGVVDGGQLVKLDLGS